MECDSEAREGIVGEGMKDGFDQNALHASIKHSNNRMIIKISLAAPVSGILSWCKECCCVFFMLFFFHLGQSLTQGSLKLGSSVDKVFGSCV